MQLPELIELRMSLEPQELSPSEFYATLYAHTLYHYQLGHPDGQLAYFPEEQDPLNPGLSDDVDLHALFLTVYLNGGYHTITSNNCWNKVVSIIGPDGLHAPDEHLEPPQYPTSKQVVKGTYCKTVYERWLLDYQNATTAIRRKHYNKILRDRKLGPSKIKMAHHRLRATIKDLTLAAADNLACGSGHVGREPPRTDTFDINGITPLEARKVDSHRLTYPFVPSTLSIPKDTDEAVKQMMARNREDAKRMSHPDYDKSRKHEKANIAPFIYDEVDEDEGLDFAVYKDMPKTPIKKKRPQKKGHTGKNRKETRIRSSWSDSGSSSSSESDFDPTAPPPRLAGYFANDAKIRQIVNSFPARYAAMCGRTLPWSEDGEVDDTLGNVMAKWRPPPQPWKRAVSEVSGTWSEGPNWVAHEYDSSSNSSF